MRFAYPEGCGGDSHGKVINLYAIELLNAYLDRIHLLEAKECLAMMTLANSLVLQATKRKICFRKEIARSACRVEEGERGKALLIGIEFFYTLPLNLFFQNLVQFVAQVSQKQWVNDFMDVLYAGVVHASTATCLWIKCTLENGSKDGR